MIDPYPPELLADDLTPLAEPDPMVRAINRLAQAVEQNTLALLDRSQPVQNAPQARPNLAPLPAVTTVAQKPPCPKHGIDKVQVSSKFAGFFCTAKDDQGPRGYCAWQFRTQA